MNSLEKHLRRFRFRLRLLDGFSAMQHSFWIPGALALMFQAAGRLFPIPHLWGWTFAPFSAWLILTWCWAFLHHFSLMAAALRTDKTARLQERLSTALAFETAVCEPSQAFLVQRQHQEALLHAANLDIRQVFPFTWHSRPIRTGSALLFLVLLSGLLPNRMNIILRDRQMIKESAISQAEAIERTSENLEKTDNLSPEDREKLLKDLEDLSQKLRQNPGDLEEALADLTSFDERLRSNIDPSLDIRGAYLEQLSRQLAQLSGSQTQIEPINSLNESMAQLEKIIESLTDEEKDRLTRQIAQFSAQAAQAGSADLRQSLSALSHAIQSGDAQSISQAFENLQADLQALDRELGDQQAFQQALTASQSAQAALANAGRQLAQAQGTPGSQMPGNQSGNLPGNQPGDQPGGTSGSQNSPGAGSPGGGGGTKANSLPPAAGGKSQIPAPQGQSSQALPGQLNQQVYAPWQRTLPGENELFITGQDTDQGNTTQSQGQSTLPGALNPALMPYTQVYPQYLNAANQAIEQAQIPVELRDFVRAYFSSLEPD